MGFPLILKSELLVMEKKPTLQMRLGLIFILVSLNSVFVSPFQNLSNRFQFIMIWPSLSLCPMLERFYQSQRYQLRSLALKLLSCSLSTCTPWQKIAMTLVGTFLDLDINLLLFMILQVVTSFGKINIFSFGGSLKQDQIVWTNFMFLRVGVYLVFSLSFY